MPVCPGCAKPTDRIVCDSCASHLDLEELATLVASYSPGQSSVMDQAASHAESPLSFRATSLKIAETLPPPRNAVVYFSCLERLYPTGPPNKFGPPLYQAWEHLEDSEALTPQERIKLRALLLARCLRDYRFEEAEEHARILEKEQELPLWSAYHLAEYFMRTRRYEQADSVLRAALACAQGDTPDAFSKLLMENEQRSAGKKRHYQPRPKEALASYETFISSLNIPSVSQRAARRSLDSFLPDSFVAFDLETTGFSARNDSIIEIGAVKVLGQGTEGAPTFQEFVRPYKSRVSALITSITGIRPQDVAHARTVDQVLSDFFDFADGLPLLGFNSARFDIPFVKCACAESGLELSQLHFDVLPFSRKTLPGLPNYKLDTVSRFLGIRNPQAHHALADALTTAKIYLSLKTRC